MAGVLSQAAEVPRKTMILFFLVDTSGSMEGDKIASLNDAMRELLPDVKNISDSNADAFIKLAVLDFASGTEWVTPKPEIKTWIFISKRQEIENVVPQNRKRKHLTLRKVNVGAITLPRMAGMKTLLLIQGVRMLLHPVPKPRPHGDVHVLFLADCP